MAYDISLKKLDSKIISIILIFLAVVFITSKHLNLHKNNALNEKPVDEKWHQPIELNEKYPELISQHSWTLEFNKIEALIKRLERNTKQKISINHDTIEKLQLIITQLNSPLPDKEWERLEFLIKQSLGNDNGDFFYNLVKNYYDYNNDEISYSNKIKTAENNKKLTLLKKSHRKYREMQFHYFGENMAEILFKRKNSTRDYLNARRIINMEDGLSHAQKKEKRSLLSENYKKYIKQW